MTNTSIRKSTTYVFILTTCLFWFSLYAYIAELSTYASSLGATYRMVGIITASYGLTQLILRIPLGIFSDMIGKRKLFITLGLTISLISSLITFYLPSAGSLLITRSLAGISASTWVIFTVMFSSYFKKEETTKAIGLMNSYNAIGQLFALSMGGLVSYLYGTRYLFLLAAGGAVIGLIGSFFIHEIPYEKKKVHFSDYLQVTKHPQLVSVSILAILSQLLTFATVFGFVPILAKNMGAENIQLSLLTVLAIIPAIIISRLAGNYIPNLIGRKNTILIGFMISSIICVVMPFLQTLQMLYVAQFIGAIGRSLVFPLLMGIGIESIDQEKRATAMGFFQAVYGIGMVLGPLLLGIIAQSYGLLTGFVVTGGFGLLGCIITWMTIKERSI